MAVTVINAVLIQAKGIIVDGAQVGQVLPDGILQVDRMVGCNIAVEFEKVDRPAPITP